MLRRAVYVITVVATTALLAPSPGIASSGGAGIAPNGSHQAQSGNGTVSATARGLTIITRASGFLRKTMTFFGSASRHDAGKAVQIELAGRQTGGKWVLTTRATINSDGSFAAKWQVNHTGLFAVRAVLGSSAGQAAKKAGNQPSWPTVKVILYRMAIATIYGPGLWGNRTACGEVLHHNTMGVANRNLPCGTPISIYYRGRTIVVPVIDRGPYANHADWDLTMATARALHIYGTETVGAAAVAHR